MRSTWWRSGGRLAALTAPLLAVVVAASPAAAQVNDDIGAGSVTGGVTFQTGYVPPALHLGCVTDGWTFQGSSEAAVYNVNGSQYAGPVSISVQGNSCATTGFEQGPITSLSASGLWVPLGIGTLKTGCSLQPGSFNLYFRFGSHVIVNVLANCYVNAWQAPNTAFVATGEFVPTDLEGGINDNITSASFDGAFAVSPSPTA